MTTRQDTETLLQTAEQFQQIMPASLSAGEWEVLARLLISQPWLVQHLIERAKKTPFTHLDGYMNRYWLFNPFPPSRKSGDKKTVPFPGLPSIRLHHILRADDAADPHNHPWEARTIILDGWYLERRDDGQHLREAGYTGLIEHGTYHHIEEVSPGGVWTMFITGNYIESWGFRKDGVHVPWKEYLNKDKPNEVAATVAP